LALPSPAELLADRGAIKSCCADVYQHPAVRWLLGGELHPGGEATTRRALELIRARPGDRLLDVASGSGASAVLAGRDFGCLVAGVEYGQEAVSEAQRAADAAGLCDRVGFTVGDAEALPFDDGEFDLLLCECSLCLFADKRRAVAEMGRVLRPGGRLAVSDVVVDRPRLPDELSGPEAAIACIGDALSLRGYEELLAGAGLRVIATESRDGDAAALAERVEDRLRGARLLGLGGADGSPLTVDKAIALAGAARRAIADGALGYAIVAAVR
jgi:SAM-dependent methyltransferase